jgi:DivIVA domain-containing protein
MRWQHCNVPADRQCQQLRRLRRDHDRMTDSNSPLVPARDDRLTPETISDRTFAAAKRGYSETEVRAYLRRVADDVASLLGRERDLAHRVSQLEGEVNQPPPALSDQQLITALGEETARVLGQAREAAVDLRNKAEEHARRVVREAQETAKELRATAQSALETKTREAEDAARARANEIVGEARGMRERVLTDLSERRQELERQIGDLRGTRGKLVDAYEAVERALGQATNLMAQETPVRVAVTPPVADAATVVAETDDDAPDDAPPAGDPAPVDPTPRSEPADEVGAPGDAVESGAAPSDDADDAESRDVSALFDQLRSEAEPADAASDDAVLGFTEVAESPATRASEEPDTGDLESGELDEELTPDQALLAARDDALAEAQEALSRRAKRALQDEQNDILDGVRRQRGKIDVDKVLPSPDDQLARWAHVLQPAVDRAYGAGAASVGATTDRAPAPVLAEMAAVVVDPLRERLASSLASIDEPTPADTEIAIAQRLGARYREWRSQHLDPVLGDVMAAAHTRGVYDAAPEGSQLRWVPFVVGKCPDCDDNALEPTVRGSEFPTGQQYPPAHPGCRCSIVVDTDD